MVLCSVPSVGSYTKIVAEELERAFEAPASDHVHLPWLHHYLIFLQMKYSAKS